jgi:hypothetical protein
MTIDESNVSQMLLALFIEHLSFSSERPAK